MSPGIALLDIPPGDLGTRAATVPAMWGSILRWSPEVRAAAEGILRECALRLERTPDSAFWRAACLYEFVKERMIYAGDHVGVEEVRDAERLLRVIAHEHYAVGDCDDQVVALGALWATVGLRFDILGTSAREDGELDHVYLVVDTELGPVAADPIDKAGAFGSTVDEAAVTAWELFPMPAEPWRWAA